MYTMYGLQGAIYKIQELTARFTSLLGIERKTTAKIPQALKRGKGPPGWDGATQCGEFSVYRVCRENIL